MRGTIGNIMALMLKELLALVRDRQGRFVLVVPPIVQLFVFGYAATFDLDHVAIAIYNEDRGALSRELSSRIEGSPHFDVVARVDHDDGIVGLIDAREVLVGLHIGPRFSADLERGHPARVQLVLDGRNSNTAMIALNYLRGIVLDFNLRRLESGGGRVVPTVLEMRAWYNENLSSRWFIVPGIIGLLTLVVTLVVTALSVAREREQGTFDQLLVTPMRPFEILIGKALPGLVVGVLQATVIVVLAVQIFDIPLRGDLVALYFGLLLFLSSAVGIGLMISSLSATQQQAVLGAFLFLVPAVILSGFATPIANMPEFVQWLTLLDPLRYFLLVVRGVFLEGRGILGMMDLYWPMAAIGLISLTAAGLLFRYRRL